MSMDDLKELQDLRKRADLLAKRIDLDEIVTSFASGDHTIREGDFVRFSDGHAARIYNISSEGKWTYFDRRGYNTEPHRVPPEDGIERLYTIQEVLAILSKGTK